MEREQKKDDAFFDDEEDISPGPAPLHPYVIPVAILIAGAMIAGAVAYTNRGVVGTAQKSATAAVGESAGAALSDPKLIAGNGPVLGNPEAPVAIVEFGDFQCPFCGRFFATTEKQIIDAYAKTGKAKFVYRDFAFLGPESEWAASAAQCAREQDKYWQYHDYLYGHQNGENQGAFTKDNLKRFALALGLDAGSFNSCLDSDKYLSYVRKDTAEGRTLGVNGTPTNFINGTAMIGALPFEQFSAVIDAELNKSK